MKECSVCHRQFDYKFTRGRCRTCYGNWWKDNNPEKHAKAKKKYYEKNKDRINKQSVEWRKENPERGREATRRWAKRHPEKKKEVDKASNKKRRGEVNRTRTLTKNMKKYGVSLQQYEESLVAGCSICKTDFITTGHNRKTPCFDHCHATGKFRGIICLTCNKLLGFARDNIEILEAAIAYLKKDT